MAFVAYLNENYLHIVLRGKNKEWVETAKIDLKTKANAVYSLPGRRVLIEISEEMDGKMDGEISGKISGKIDGEMDEKMDGEISGKTDGEISGEMDGEISGEMDGKIDGEISGKTDGEISGKTDGKMDGEISGEMDGKMDGEISGEMDGKMDGKIDGKPTKYGWYVLDINRKYKTAESVRISVENFPIKGFNPIQPGHFLCETTDAEVCSLVKFSSNGKKFTRERIRLPSSSRWRGLVACFLSGESTPLVN